MRCASRASRVGAGRALARLLAIGFVLAFGVVIICEGAIAVAIANIDRFAHPNADGHADADTVAVANTTPIPSPTPTMINSTVSAGATVTNLGSNFLERLGTSNGFSRMLRTNPGGGGASETTETPRYRTWFEGYGISATNGPLGAVRRRQQENLGRGGRDRRARHARLQYRFLGRPEPHRHRRAAGAAIGDDRSDPARLQCLRRCRPVDLGQRDRARLWQHQFAPRHRPRLCHRRLQCAASTA